MILHLLQLWYFHLMKYKRQRSVIIYHSHSRNKLRKYSFNVHSHVLKNEMSCTHTSCFCSKTLHCLSSILNWNFLSKHLRITKLRAFRPVQLVILDRNYSGTSNFLICFINYSPNLKSKFVSLESLGESRYLEKTSWNKAKVQFFFFPFIAILMQI